MSEAAAAAVAGSPPRVLRSGRPTLPDALPVLVASPGRRQQQQQQQRGPQQEELAAGAAGGVHARRPSTSSSASSTSSNSSTSTVGSTGSGGGGMKAGGHTSHNNSNEAATRGRLHGSPTRRRQLSSVGALPTLQAPPSSPAKATRASVAAGLGGLLVVPAEGPAAAGAAAAQGAPPPVSPRPKQEPQQLEEQASPLRRSQTQHLREAAAGGTPGGAGGAGQGGGGADGKGAHSPPMPPRIGERFQVPDDDLPRNMRDDVGAACYDPWNIAGCAQKGLVWHPEDVDEEVARAFAAEIGESAAAERCGDEGAELGWLVLRATGSVERAVAAAEDETLRGQWSREEEAAFVQGMKDHDKNFRRIKELLPNRSLQEVIRHFYLWKQTDEYRSWKAERPLQYVEQAIPDYHADTCDKCDRPGDLLCCDTCNLAFHMRCLGLREHEVPDDFSCEQCQAQYTRPEDRERAKRWVEFQVNRVLQQREKELAKCEGAPQGYIGRMRATTEVEKNKKGRKRKRQDVNSSTGNEEGEGEGGGEGQGEAKRSEPATAVTAAAPTTATAAASAAGQQGRGSGGSSSGQWTSLLQPLPSSSSSSSGASVSSAEEGKQPGGGGGGGGGNVDYSSSSSSLNSSSQRRRSGRVAAIAAGAEGLGAAAAAPVDGAGRR